MKLDDFAISTNVFARYSLQGALQLLRKVGFRRIELWGHVSQMHSGDFTPTAARELADRLRNEGFESVAFFPEGEGCPWNPASECAAVRERAVEYYAHCLELAKAMEIGRMIVHPGYGLLDHAPETDMEAATESWHRIGKCVEALRVEWSFFIAKQRILGVWNNCASLCDVRMRNLGFAQM